MPLSHPLSYSEEVSPNSSSYISFLLIVKFFRIIRSSPFMLAIWFESGLFFWHFSLYERLCLSLQDLDCSNVYLSWDLKMAFHPNLGLKPCTYWLQRKVPFMCLGGGEIVDMKEGTIVTYAGFFLLPSPLNYPDIQMCIDLDWTWKLIVSPILFIYLVNLYATHLI